MNQSIGIESHVFMREARKARRTILAASGGIGVPFSADSLVQAMIRFWCG